MAGEANCPQLYSIAADETSPEYKAESDQNLFLVVAVFFDV